MRFASSQNLRATFLPRLPEFRGRIMRSAWDEAVVAANFFHRRSANMRWLPRPLHPHMRHASSPFAEDRQRASADAPQQRLIKKDRVGRPG